MLSGFTFLLSLPAGDTNSLAKANSPGSTFCLKLSILPSQMLLYIYALEMPRPLGMIKWEKLMKSESKSYLENFTHHLHNVEEGWWRGAYYEIISGTWGRQLHPGQACSTPGLFQVRYTPAQSTPPAFHIQSTMKLWMFESRWKDLKTPHFV